VILSPGGSFFTCVICLSDPDFDYRTVMIKCLLLVYSYKLKITTNLQYTYMLAMLKFKYHKRYLLFTYNANRSARTGRCSSITVVIFHEQGIIERLCDPFQPNNQ